MNALHLFLLAVGFLPAGFSANLAISTYFKDGFTPSALGSDAQGNLFVAGTAITDPASQTTGVAVAKLDPKAGQYLYLTYLDSAASDQVSAMAVDAAGYSYVVGWTTNSNFPSTGGGGLGTPPANDKDERAFLTKLSPTGLVVFSVLLGGSVPSRALGVTVTPQGQVLVSGIADASGFAVTAGAFRVPDSKGHWYLMEVDASASRVIFSATGIGGSSIVTDSAGNIYLAGSSVGTDYPTTPGAYQTTLVQGYYCYSLCQISSPGNLQHVTKIDPAGSKLIYSTGLNDPNRQAGSTTNTGLAVDAAGNAYVTGTLLEGNYPFTVPTSRTNIYNGYVSKLDPTGSSLVFAIPFGGGGVALDANGALYVGATVSDYSPLGIGLPPGPPPTVLPDVLSWIPQACRPDTIKGMSGALVLKLDAATGNQIDGQWIQGSGPTATAITVAAGKVWLTGATLGSDVAITPGAVAPPNVGQGYLSGAFLAAADFTSNVAGQPAIACVLDTGNLSHVHAVAAWQVISIFGANLGPATGVVAPDGTDPSVAGVTVTFNGQPGQLFYVSSSQINVVVPAPAPSRDVVPRPTSMTMVLTANGATIQRQLPFVIYNLNMFADISTNQPTCSHPVPSGYGVQPLSANADGSKNTCDTPAAYGSVVSVFVHGPGALQYGFPPPTELFGVQAMVEQCSALVEKAALLGNYVYQVDVLLPSANQSCLENSNPGEQGYGLTLTYNGLPVGPLTPYGQAMRTVIWVAP